MSRRGRPTPARCERARGARFRASDAGLAMSGWRTPGHCGGRDVGHRCLGRAPWPVTWQSDRMDGGLRRESAQGRWVLTAAVLGSGMAMLDSFVVNVALRDIGLRLDASVAELQWVVNAYLLSLASLILVGGSLGDRFGRRRVFLFGVVWFAVSSGLCGLAQNPGQLIVARLVQGVGAALLTPGSLAMIQGSFHPDDRGRVIGQWAGLGGIAAAIGPLLGGWIVDVASWRYIFWINLPVAVVVVTIGLRHVPETKDPRAVRGYDLTGSVLAGLGLGGVTYALIEPGRASATAGIGGVLALAAFVLVEARSEHPIMPLGLYRSRLFTVANLMTLLVYGALGALLFFLVIQLQVSVGYSPLEAGVATVPITILMLVLSPRSGDLAARIGPRLQMSVGPLLCALGVLMLRGVGEGSSYLADILPGLTLFSLGLVTLVAPLTVSVLAAVADHVAGVASGVNNAVARTGTLLAVAALPAIVAVNGADYQRPEVFSAGYGRALLICAVLLVAGGLVSAVGVPGPVIARIPAPTGTATVPEAATSGATEVTAAAGPEAGVERLPARHAPPTGWATHEETCCVPSLPGWVNPPDDRTRAEPARRGGPAED